MNKKITILGIESSCDETAVSVVQEENGETKILLPSLQILQGSTK